MSNLLKRLFICFAAILLPCSAAFAALSPVGMWKTIDDVSNEPKSIINITQNGNGTLSGQILKIWPAPGKSEKEVCSVCTGERRNMPIVGMTVMEGLSQSKEDPNEWRDGTILDPSTGKFYHTFIKVISNGQKLRVRGYVGLPVFGRTQTWEKVSSLSG